MVRITAAVLACGLRLETFYPIVSVDGVSLSAVEQQFVTLFVDLWADLVGEATRRATDFHPSIERGGAEPKRPVLGIDFA